MSKVFPILIYISLLEDTYNVFIFNFKKLISNIENEDNFLNYITSNQYIANLSIGNPSQNIPININLNKEYFFILGNNTGNYNEELSSTLELSDTKITSNHEYFISGYKSNESISLYNLNEKLIQILKLPFVLVNKKAKNTDFILSGGIGFGYQSQSSPNENFLKYLSDKKYIDSYTYYIKFDNKNENEGKIYFGNYPHEFDKRNYPENIFSYFSTPFLSSEFIWEIPFEYFEIENDRITISSIDFNNSLNGIIANDAFKKIFDEYYFAKYYNKTCNYKTQGKKTFIYCNKDLDIKNFSNLNFYSKHFNYTFELSFNDLFKKEGDKYYFLIVFDKQIFRNFQFGEPFFRKYPFVFDQDRKFVGFYKFDKLKNEYNFVLWILVFIFFILCVILGICLMKNIYYKPRKIRANELEENYSYIPILK